MMRKDSDYRTHPNKNFVAEVEKIVARGYRVVRYSGHYKACAVLMRVEHTGTCWFSRIFEHAVAHDVSRKIEYKPASFWLSEDDLRTLGWTTIGFPRSEI